MEFGKVRVKISGLTPLLMNRLNPDSLKHKSRLQLKEYNIEEEARASAYIDEIDGKTQLYIPGYAIYSMIINTAKQYRTRKTSLSSLLAGTIRIEPEKIPLGTDKYEIDVRPVMIKKDRVLKARAMLPKWEAEFFIIYNKQMLPINVIETLKTILEDGGLRMGILDYRPQHKGWFGTFEVKAFEVLE